MSRSLPVIALESRLKACKNVLTLGVRTNFSDYSSEETELIRDADKIYYPTPFYADLFDVMGKPTFPSYHTYKCVQDKIKQTAMFNLLNISHPQTRIFYGQRQKAAILKYFDFPFIAKIPRGSALGRGVFLISDKNDLGEYCRKTKIAYIQKYLPIDRDIRVVVIGKEIIHAYWRVSPPGEFRSNVAVGGIVSFESVPRKALDLALETARLCRWDDVGIDICEHDGTFYVLEANMKYGRQGFRQAGMDYIRIMENLIEDGKI